MIEHYTRAQKKSYQYPLSHPWYELLHAQSVARGPRQHAVQPENGDSASNRAAVVVLHRVRPDRHDHRDVEDQPGDGVVPPG